VGEVAGQHRAVIVGYGPVGRTLDRILRANDFLTTVIEMNVETVRAIKAGGGRAVHGDATHPDILEAAGVGKAVALILTGSTIQGPGEVVRAARALNPAITIHARVSYLRERDALRAAGADEVFSGEGEVAMAMTESLLNRLGATPDQIDRERDRIRGELFGALETAPSEEAPHSSS
jgi:CPA2 family monovalent cation:H+ antiporter-2